MPYQSSVVPGRLRILLIDDDEDDFVITRDLLQEIDYVVFELDWRSDPDQGLGALRQQEYDVCLLDYRLGGITGLELLEQIKRERLGVPVIMLTGQGDERIDLEAMRIGAADYLVKSRIDAALIGRSIRYAYERKRRAEEQRRADAEMRLLRTLALAIGEARDLSSALSTMLEQICRETGWACGEIWFPDEDDGLLRRAAFSLGEHTLLSPFFGDVRFAPGHGLPGQAWLRREPVWDPDVSTTLSFIRISLARELGLHAGFAVPILASDEVVAVLALYDFETRDEDERMLALTSAVAAQLGAVLQRKQVEEALRVAEAKHAALLHNIPDMAWFKDARGRYLAVNEAMARACGRPPAEIVGKTDFALWPTALAHGYLADDERVLQRRAQTVVEEALQRADGTRVWIETVKTPFLDASGVVAGTVGIARDVTQRRRAEERERLLAEAGRLFSSSLDYRETLKSLAGLLVPALADWCVIDVLGDGGRVDTVEIVAEDPSREAAIHEMLHHYPYEPGESRHPIGEVLRTGTSRLIPEVDDALLRRAADTDYLRRLRSLAPRSSIMVPLTAHGQVLGAMVLTTSESDRKYDSLDLVLAEEIARRAAVAVDNARLYQRAREAREQAERAAERTARLQRLTAAFSGAVTPQEVASIAIREALDLIGATAGALSVAREGRDSLELMHAVGPSGQSQKEWTRLIAAAAAPLADSMRTGEPLWIESEEHLRRRYPELAPLYSRLQGGSIAVFPLHGTSGEPLGALALGLPEWRPFSGEDRGLLGLVARQCAQPMERARLYASEQEARAHAEAATRARDEVLGIVAHDLRNPLSAMDMTAKILLEVDFSQEQTEQHLQAIERCAQQMDRLIQDLLDVTRIEAGQLRIETERVRVEPLLDEAVRAVELGANQKGLCIRKEASGVLPALRVDRDRLLQVFSNLLGNALKFTPPGGTITAGAVRERDRVRFWVLDTGTGIPEHSLPHLFDRFWQARSSRRGGAGLGLAIAKGIIEAHGGRIWVESTPGVGTTMHFTLPVETE